MKNMSEIDINNTGSNFRTKAGRHKKLVLAGIGSKLEQKLKHTEFNSILCDSYNGV